MKLTFIKLGTLIGHNNESQTKRIREQLERLGLEVKEIHDEATYFASLEENKLREVELTTPLYFVSAHFRFGKAVNHSTTYIVEATPIKIEKKGTEKRTTRKKGSTTKPAKKNS